MGRVSGAPPRGIGARIGPGGRFELLAPLGEGGMGVVHEALDHEQDTLVAVKTLPRLTGDALLRFKTEFRTLQDLQHPNLVTLREMFEEDGQWFFTMDLVQGSDFLRYVRADRSAARRSASETAFDEGKLRAAVAQLARGLAALHAAKKVHRDIKPSNVLVTTSGHLKILDFGLVANRARGAWEPLVVGTPSYMAPEQAGGAVVGPEADWYSVGVVLYAALTGQPPFLGTTEVVLKTKQETNPPAPSTRVRSPLPRDLEQLAIDLLERDPAKRPRARAVLARLGVVEDEGSAFTSGTRRSDPGVLADTVFVGRDGELAMCARAWQSAKSGQVTLRVHGESGVGKSALVARFCERVAADEARAIVLSGRCYERESVPFKALDGIVDALSDHLLGMSDEEIASLLPADGALIAHVFPVLRRVTGIGSNPPPMSTTANPEVQRTRLFAAMRELFARLCATRRVAIVIDDLQWSDADSLALLRHLLRPPGAPPFLLLATMRSGAEILSTEGHALDVSLPGDVRHISLVGLPATDARALASHLLAAGTIDASAAAIADEAHGHPMFIDELVRHARASRVAGSQRELRLEDALASRVKALDPRALRVLELASVAGEPLSLEMVADAAGVDLGELSELAAVLRSAHMARTTGARLTDRIEPYHDRVRSAVIASLDQGAKHALHRRLAEALERAPSAEPEALALHWREAGEAEPAIKYTVIAAERASLMFAFNRAAQLYRAAIDLADPGRLRAIELTVKLGDALTCAGRSIEAAEAFLSTARAMGSSPRALELRRRAAQQLLVAGRFDRGLEEMRDVLAVVGLEPPSNNAGAIASMLVRRAHVRLRGLGFRRRSEEEVPASALLQIDTCWAAVIGLGLVDVIRGADFQSRHLLLALRAGEPTRICRALSAEIAFSAAEGTNAHARTMSLLDVLERQVEALGKPTTLHGMAVGVRGVVAHLEGRFDEVAPLFAEAERLMSFHWTESTRWELDNARVLAYAARAWMGELRELRECVPAFLEEGVARQNLHVVTHMTTGVHVMAWLARDDTEGAMAALDDGIAVWDPSRTHVPHVLDGFARVQALLYARDHARAYAVAHDRWRTTSRAFLLKCQLLRVHMLSVRSRAALALAMRDDRNRDRLLREAERDANDLEGERAAWAGALGALVHAGVARARGDRMRARAKLDSAVTAFDTMGLALHEHAARRARGVLLGSESERNEEARAQIAAADEWMLEQSVVDPARLTEMIAPGFE